MLKNGKYRDKGGSFKAVLTDLSKTFDCLLHDLLIAKLHAYGFDMASLKLIYTYLCGRKQRLKINDKCSLWEEILFRVPQRPILGPLLFNIFICDLFLFTNNIDIASYADDNTPYATSSKTNLAIKILKQCSDSLFTWFQNNGMKANADNVIFSVYQSRITLTTKNIGVKNFGVIIWAGFLEFRRYKF